ncbi:MAG: hypothetical protein Ta2G_05430 [Termitinemataceae bacterium]|nr:MAG: hypothetical protein Ta2G_05430 [Termitinemataceae bacterium]
MEIFFLNSSSYPPPPPPTPKNAVTLYKIISYAIFFLAFAPSLFAKGQDIPPWATNPNLQLTWSPDDYIAEIGSSSTEKLAKSSSEQSIIKYFIDSINTEIPDAASMIESEVKFIPKQYSAPYHKSKTEWQIVAIIDREAAWKAYKPRFDNAANAYRKLIKAAEGETDALKQFFAYEAAANYALSKEFFVPKSVAEIIYPEVFKSSYSDVNSAFLERNTKVKNARDKVKIFVSCEGDYNNIVTTELSKVFSENGFDVATKANAAAYTCKATAAENTPAEAEGVIAFRPTLTVQFLSKDGVMFSYSRGSRGSGYQKDAAKRSAYNNLAKEIRNSFFSEFLKETISK